MIDELKQIFDFSEIEHIRNTTIKDRCHPVKRLLYPRPGFGRDERVILNTEKALRQIIQHDSKWLMSLKPRLLNVEDYSTSSGALGEIRAFQYLLQTGVYVNPIGKSGSDFLLSEGEEEAFVEVHCKQLNRSEAEALENFYNNLRNKACNNNQANQGWNFTENRIVPLGKPKKVGETITENAISKLAAIKDKEHQMSSEKTSILWLDFQDEIWDLLDTLDRVLPVRTLNNAFYSGELWYAFYGWKDAPIYEAYRWDMLLGNLVTMKHLGRFTEENNTKLDAVIISFSGDTIILENPYTQKPIKPWLWKRLVRLPWFNFEMSYTNWPAVNLKRRIELEKEKIIGLSSISL